MMDRNFEKHCKDYVQGQIAARNLLIRYARNERGEPYGVLVGVRASDGIRVSHSFCNFERGDKFNKYVGIYIAAKRALNDDVINGYRKPKIRHTDKLNFYYEKMYERASKYWKVSPVNV